MATNDVKIIEQYASFLNTNGYIENDNNVYYMPHELDTTAKGTSISIRYAETLKGKCGGYRQYTNTPISRWTPQDRVLSIKGNIDYFRGRLTNSSSIALNYVLIERKVYSDSTKTSLTSHYYMGFFITDATQTGMNTVRLELTPDDFTNVFFLMNTKDVGSGYANDVYDLIGNPWIERTHLDRIKKTSSGYTLRPRKIARFINNEEKYKYSYQVKDYCYPISFNGGELTSFTEDEITTINTTSNFTSLPTLIQEKIIKCCLCWGIVKCREPLTMNTLLAQYSVGAQGRQMRPYDNGPKKGYSVNKIVSPMQTIILPSINIRKEFVKYSEYLNNITFSFNINKIYGLSTNSSGDNTPDSVVVFDTSYNKYFTHDKNTTVPFLTLESFTAKMNTNAWADRILSITIVRDLNVNYGLEIGSRSYQITFTGGVTRPITLPAVAPDLTSDYFDRVKDNYNVNITSVPLPKGLWGCFLPNNVAQSESGGGFFGFNENEDKWDFNIAWKDNDIDKAYYFALVVSGEDVIDTKIYLPEPIYTKDEAKTTLFDTMLVTNPYEFYSISCVGGIEFPLDKQKYFNLYNVQGNIYNVPLKYLTSNNDCLKIGIIPTYDNGGVSYQSLADCLVVSLASTLPMSSDSYQSYYYQNLAQMKNAYAVNNYRRGIEMLNHAFNEAPANVGVGFLTGGNKGGLTAGIKETSKQISMAVDWASSNTIIDMNNKATLAGAGARPDTIKQAGTDVYYELLTGDMGFMLNHYTIDKPSKNSICRYLERYGYYFDRYGELDLFSRHGYNYLKLSSFDFVKSSTLYPQLNIDQMNKINEVFTNGVTIVHDSEYLKGVLRNYEIILDE